MASFLQSKSCMPKKRGNERVATSRWTRVRTPSEQRRPCKTARWMACPCGLNGPRLPPRGIAPGRFLWSRHSTSASDESLTDWQSTWRRRATLSSRLSWSASCRTAPSRSSSSTTRSTTSTIAGGPSPSHRATTLRCGGQRCSRCLRAALGGGHRSARSSLTRRGAQTSPLPHHLPRARRRCPSRPQPPQSLWLGRESSSRVS
mmetsp:Transcript_80709/g.237184  ORF Transcript_80709/g.237184 Transcript_80709/m.237184 type:complete len:203 (-) Transcript_80709:1998-2606(-)